MKKLFFILLLLNLTRIWASPSLECLDSVKNYFETEIDQKTLDKFLSIQSRLTMNKLAWANLKLGQDSSTIQVEKNILGLLKTKHDNSDPKVQEAVAYFEKQPLSRVALAKVAPILSNILKEQEGDNSPYTISSSDIKMLEILAETEKTYTNGKQDIRHFTGRTVNLVSLLNSSYRNINSPEFHKKNIDFLQDEIIISENSLYDLLKDIPIPAVCSETIYNNGCKLSENDNLNFSDLYFNIDEIQAVATSTLFSLKTEKDVLNSVGFGKLWPKVVLESTGTTASPLALRKSLEFHYQPEKIEISKLPPRPIKFITVSDNTRVIQIKPTPVQIESSKKVDELVLEEKKWDYNLNLDEKSLFIPNINNNPDILKLNRATGLHHEVKNQLHGDAKVKYSKLQQFENVYLIEVPHDNRPPDNAGAYMLVRIYQDPNDRNMPDYLEVLDKQTNKGGYLPLPYQTIDEKLCEYNTECQNISAQIEEFENIKNIDDYFDQFVLNNFFPALGEDIFGNKENNKVYKEKVASEFKNLTKKNFSDKELQSQLENIGRNAFGRDYDMNSADIFEAVRTNLNAENLQGEARSKRMDELFEYYDALVSFRDKVQNIDKYKQSILKLSCKSESISSEYQPYCKLMDARDQKIEAIRTDLKPLDPAAKTFPLNGYSRFAN
jgi:hypothetical protein